MIPLLHDSENINETYGRGKLAGIISCEIREVLNGEYELELRYPVTGPMYEKLLNGGTVQCIGAPVGSLNDKRAEWFDIYKHTLPIDGVVTFYASHISRRLSRRVVTGPLYSRYPQYVITQSYPSGNFGTVQVGFSSLGTQSLPDQHIQISPKSSLSALIGEDDSIISLFGGDMTFYCGFSGGLSITEFLTVSWDVNGRGADRGAQVRYGYNMTGIDYTQDASDTFNAVVPYWDDGNGNKTYVTGYIVQPTTPITPVRAAPMDCTDAFDSQPTGAQLAQYAQDWLDSNAPWVSTETISVDFVNGIDFDKNSPKFDLGDTVHVYWGDAQVAAELRVVEYTFDVISETFKELKLGKKQSNFVAITGIDGGSAAGGAGTIENAEYYKAGDVVTIDQSIVLSGYGQGTGFSAELALPKSVLSGSSASMSNVSIAWVLKDGSSAILSATYASCAIRTLNRIRINVTVANQGNNYYMGVIAISAATITFS